MLAGPPIGPTAAPRPTMQPVQSVREIALPISVSGPDGAARIGHAEISIAVLSREGGVARRGKAVARGATGPKGEPCVIRLAPSSDRLLVEARQHADESVSGSMVIAFDPESSNWKTASGPDKSHSGENVSGQVGQKPTQPTLSVKIPERVAARVYAIAAEDERLASAAEILIFTTSGQCIRRGSSRSRGDAFEAEHDGPLHPGYRRLWVVARAKEGDRSVVGSTLLVFEHNNWLPATRYERFATDTTRKPGRWLPEHDFDAATGQFSPIVQGSVWTPGQIRVMIPIHALPVSKSAVDGDATPGALPAGDAPRPSVDVKEIVDQLGLRPEPLASSAMKEIALRESAIVEAGRPLSPDHAWADFGRRWTRGPVGMYWQAAIETERL